MLLLDDPLLHYKRRRHYTLVDYLTKHLSQVQALQYHDGDQITKTCRYLSIKLADYARSNSPVYRSHKGLITKADLTGGDWYIQGLASHIATTGGSTTGQRFQYLRWATHYSQIEGDLHYKAILREFGLTNATNVLYFMLDKMDSRSDDKLIDVCRTNNILISHGCGPNAKVHEVIKNRLYYNDYYKFYESILDYCNDKNIDIILAPGQIIASLAWHVKRLGFTKPICRLLSNTGDKVNLQDLDYLKTNGNIGSWCDHMRCWDGGITFMTCHYHTYHLVDGLAWTRSDKQDRLISDDYYSLPSPFVNYWNGDYGTVGTEFSRCRCGRYYRDFNISRTRDVMMAGVTNCKIRDAIIGSGVDCADIKRAETSGNFMRLFTNRIYSISERRKIRSVLPTLEINFVAEEDDG